MFKKQAREKALGGKRRTGLESREDKQRGRRSQEQGTVRAGAEGTVLQSGRRDEARRADLAMQLPLLVLTAVAARSEETPGSASHVAGQEGRGRSAGSRDGQG